MDSFEFNKIAGAVLGTCLLVFGLKIAGELLFDGEAPEKAGFAVAGAEEHGAEGGATAEPTGPKETLGALLAKADVAKGEAKSKACAACHDFTKGGPNKTGPALYGIIGHGIGAKADFAYSDAVKAQAGKNWDYVAIDEWLKAPKEYIKGTKMGFSGIKNDQERANLIAYMATLSDAPVAFPAP